MKNGEEVRFRGGIGMVRRGLAACMGDRRGAGGHTLRIVLVYEAGPTPVEMGSELVKPVKVHCKPSADRGRHNSEPTYKSVFGDHRTVDHVGELARCKTESGGALVDALRIAIPSSAKFFKKFAESQGNADAVGLVGRDTDPRIEIDVVLESAMLK